MGPQHLTGTPTSCLLSASLDFVSFFAPSLVRLLGPGPAGLS